MRPKILIVYPIPQVVIETLQKQAELIYPKAGRPFTKDEIIEKIPDCQGLLSIFNQEVNGEILKAAKKLRIIANYGVGYNNINTRIAIRKNIVVCNTPDPVTEPTAVLTMSLILSLLRKTSQFERALRSGNYKNWDMMHNLGTSLNGKTLGVVGLGKIGKSVAFKARAFGLKIKYYQRRRLSGLEEDSWFAEYSRFDDLLKTSDILSIHVPLSPETHHMIAENELEMMKKGAYLINTARGAVIDEKALLKALQSNHLAGAALDVFENEPEITEGLLDLENVVAVPHIGTQTHEARIEMGLQAAQNLIDFFEGKIPQNRVV